jgi:hypothetical protein
VTDLGLSVGKERWSVANGRSSVAKECWSRMKERFSVREVRWSAGKVRWLPPEPGGWKRPQKPSAPYFRD